MLHTLSASGNTLYAILEVAYKGLLQLCVVINPIMQVFFLCLILLLKRYGLDFLFYGIFLISWIRLLIVFGCHPSRTLNNDFKFAILVTLRIINFRLFTLSALLPLIFSLCTMIFQFAILVTPRIINFRLAPAFASLRLTRSLRIYYSMLCEF